MNTARRYAPAAPILAAILLSACAGAGGFARLPGWTSEDHAAGLAAFQKACSVASSPGVAEVCARARELGPARETRAKRFLETNFRLQRASGPGLLTAYFSPIYDARRTRGGDFTAPLRPRPPDLPRADWGPGGSAHYVDRTAIEARETTASLAWLRPEELFILQIQGSGSLVFEDRTRARAAFDGDNGAPFLAIGAVLKRRGLIGRDGSGEDVRRWLAANRGPLADEVMRLDRRYVFFRLLPDDGDEPSGAAGVPLIPGRTIAVDLAAHHLGELFWMDAEPPDGGLPGYRRLAVALDTGGALEGAARADLYLGRGPAAGLEAGRVRHVLYLYRLAPNRGHGR
ncbi:MAG TPA: MltA domain-containing protein [Caulobacteraceae bacterium]